MRNSLTQLNPAPPFTIGAALILWGWQTGFMLYATPLIILIELYHWVSWRWPITNREFNIISDLSGLIFFIVVVYIFSTEGAKGIFVILSVMPFILFLLLVLQLYSEQGRIRLSALFISLRKLDPQTSKEATAEIDLSLPYILLCIVSASSGNQRTIWFFILTFFLITLVLWTCRPKRYPIALWAGMLGLAFILAYAGQGEIRRFQRSIEATIIGVFDQFMWRYRDPDRATTAIGTIGRLKLSDRVILRVKPYQDLRKTLLLGEASYQRYNYGVWSNSDSSYTVIDPEISGTAWTLADGKPENNVEISVYMPTVIGVIPLPQGTTRIRDISAIEISRSDYGTVKMEIREGWINYRADYDNSVPDDIIPSPEDTEIADNYRDTFERLASNLDLYHRSESEAVEIIENYFAENFQYSLTQNTRYPRGQYLHNFLFNTQEGHCEFFATSTALLLRTLGIPARYVAGYAISEYSMIEGQYIGRSRDAHSWVMAYVDNAWQIIDTTPPVWIQADEANAAIYQPLLDVIAWISYRVALFQSRDELKEEASYDYLLYLLIPLISILAWRLYFKQRIRNKTPSNTRFHEQKYQGMDSAVYQLTHELNKKGYVRRRGETLSAWLKRVNEQIQITNLDEILKLHYQYRFDPLGDNSRIKARLTAIVRNITAAGLLPRDSVTGQ